MAVVVRYDKVRPVKVRLGLLRSVMVGLLGHVGVSCGPVWQSRFGLVRCGAVRLGLVRRGMVWQSRWGLFRLGLAWQCWARQLWWGSARHGKAGLGAARRGVSKLLI
jgi:hypothetical protein